MENTASNCACIVTLGRLPSNVCNILLRVYEAVAQQRTFE
jgi:hypothetical protein